ncbi:hypothetical protein COLO4_09250 [Corchorus olitorius]|uniref:Uncharacterized protein n=1 Tax=Corchorus olitorius TaxID=93759 RepID=A0A1R3KCN8_9ROSI|nr:hypothetical protein COLO4_09250 [Corchorus olitorius]
MLLRSASHCHIGSRSSSNGSRESRSALIVVLISIEVLLFPRSVEKESQMEFIPSLKHPFIDLGIQSLDDQRLQGIRCVRDVHSMGGEIFLHCCFGEIIEGKGCEECVHGEGSVLSAFWKI